MENIKDDYYKEIDSVSFSDLKVFSKCQQLYKDLKIDKSYEEKDADYFTYGKLVDAMLTEAPEFIDENFIRVERKINIEDALKIENKIKEHREYIENPEFLAKLEKGNVTSQKGLEKRIREIGEWEVQLKSITSCAHKCQVTPSIWKNAEETALAIKTHPSYAYMVFNQLTSQQVFHATINGVKRRGKLDHLKLSPALEKLYGIYKANKMTKEELQEQVVGLNENDKWAMITDIKTCYSIQKVEPYNTHYRGQLGYYQDLVCEFFQLSPKRVLCRILAGDKLSSEFKISELFQYTQESLDDLKPDVEAWVQKWNHAMTNNDFKSDKELNGIEQNCFKCSQCRISPFSMKIGEPFIVSKPRFPDYKSSSISDKEVIVDNAEENNQPENY